MSEHDELDQYLLQLVQETCAHPPQSRERRQGLNRIIAVMQQSGRIWRDNSIRDYEDALQKSWIYFCANLCEATTAKRAYNPQERSVIAWFNAHLKFRIKDCRLEQQKEQNERVHPWFTSDGDLIDPIDMLPAPDPLPSFLEETLTWLKQERDKLLQIHVRKRPDINAYSVIQHRLPDRETKWKDVAAQFNVTIPVVSGFYQNKCLPLLLSFGESQGYLDLNCKSPDCKFPDCKFPNCKPPDSDRRFRRAA